MRNFYVIFSDDPRNWSVYSQGFYHAGLKLAEESQKRSTKSKLIGQEEVFTNRYSYKISIYLLSHAIELLLKSIVSAYNANPENIKIKKSIDFGHNIVSIVDKLIKADVLILENKDHLLFDLINEYLM